LARLPYTILFSFHNKRMKTNRASLHEQWLPYMHIIMNMSY
jgi:hypothetical protein